MKRGCRKWFVLLVIMIGCLQAYGQNGINTKISGDYKDMTILEILNAIENQYPVQFMYDPSYISYFKISYAGTDVTLYDALDDILRSTGMVGVAKDNKTIIIVRTLQLSRDRINEIYDKWTSGEFEIPTSDAEIEMSEVIGASTPGVTEIVLSGNITDVYNNEGLIGATITNTSTSDGVVSDEVGDYSITLPVGKHELRIEYFGYQAIVYDLEIYEDANRSFEMNVNPLTIEEVVISAQSPDQAVKEVTIGVATISNLDIKELPTFLGEADIIKSLQTLPGVSSVGEGASGFNVRGGNIDQNLVTLDGSRLYNTSHALGFFSVFNVDVIDNVKLYKGHIPARYGGRVSSYLDVDLKDGNYDKVKGAGGIGLMSSKLTIEGPIVKDKLSAVVGLRSSYTDWIALLIDVPNVEKSSVNFGDVTLKLSQKLNNGSLALSGYYSYDNLAFADDFGYKWSTLTGNIDYNQIINEQWSLYFNANLGRYSSDQLDLDRFNGFEYGTGMNDYGSTLEALYVPSEGSKFVIGAQGVFYDTAPETIAPTVSGSSIGSNILEKEQAQLLSAYIDGEFSVTPRLSISAGLRFNTFTALGAARVAMYQERAPREVDNIIETQEFQKGESVKSYTDFEPRISLNYRLKENQSIKASYNRLSQYVHLMSNTTASTPVDIWQLSNFHLKPQRANNYSLGYFLNLNDNGWENSIEVYYKEVKNIPVFKNLPDIALNENIESEIVDGNGRAMGVELSVKKNIGRWTGQFSYTYSISELRTASEFDSEQINNGNWFKANYDQPHSIGINARYQVRPKSFWVFGFTYNSGRPITLPSGGYYLDNVLITDYADRNAGRIPAYHRFDLGYTYTNEKARIKGVKSSVTLSLYNLYGRRNPFSVFFRRDARNIPRTYRLSIIGSMFPSITYNFNF